ncbi:MAG TPA: NCS2 family permease [Phycisphaerae bacterium]|nr:NCS2 family permease [Phycisphaerae bacterium]
MFEKLFGLREHGTTVGREIVGGAATFMALSYIIFVQPVVLGMAGMDPGAVMVATCVCSALACVLMGLTANLPVALAPAMGHNFFFAFTVCGVVTAGGLGWTWQEALAANLIAGVVFLVLAAAGFQQALARAIPESLKYAIAVGIGLLIAFVGLRWGGIVVHEPAAYTKLGSLRSPTALLTCFGLLLIAILLVLRVRGAILIGIVVTAAAGLAASHLWGATWGYDLAAYGGRIVAPPPSVAPTAGKVFGGFASLLGAGWTNWLTVIFIFLILDLFDTIGTLVGVAERGGLMRNGEVPNMRAALVSDACGTIAGTLAGTSTVTSYVESAAGISAGGRTGLTPIVTGVLLLASLFFYPVVEMVGKPVMVPPEHLGAVPSVLGAVECHPVIAPVLIVIGCYMLPMVARINWEDFSEAIPAFLCIVVMQFGLSISHGIAWGFISYAILKVVQGRVREVPPLMWVFAALFVVFLVAA